MIVLSLGFVLAANGLTASADVVLVIKPDSPGQSVARQAFDEAFSAMRVELEENDFQIQTLRVNTDLSAEGLRNWIYAVNPRVVVLMDNKALGIYSDYQKGEPVGARFPPALALMAVHVDSHMHTIQNATAIRYEVHGITSLVNLRALLDIPIRKVGVVYRPKLTTFYREQKEQCLGEKIELVGRVLSDDGNFSISSIRRNIEILLKEEKVDAIWVLNDSSLLSAELVRRAWRPMLRRAKKPVVVGVRRFVTEGLLGHFAVSPDHQELGLQAATLIFDIRDNQWRLPIQGAHAPIGVHKALNRRKMPRALRGKLVEDALLELDEIVQ